MTKELFFQKHVFPYLENVINWKEILFLNESAISYLEYLGLIKEREPADRDIDSFIVCGKYKIQYHRYLYFVSKIQKGDEILYEYSDEKAAKKMPGFKTLKLH